MVSRMMQHVIQLEIFNQGVADILNTSHQNRLGVGDFGTLLRISLNNRTTRGA